MALNKTPEISTLSFEWRKVEETLTVHLYQWQKMYLILQAYLVYEVV